LSIRQGARSKLQSEQNLIGIVAVQPNATPIWLCLFSSNKIEILLILPENELHQQKVAFSLPDLAVCV
jgi:hypothetical protein